mmetsp:Transcript_3130/g.4635  ORF Transcript_3130/g.4635 Transcript_3130/m.4635 type:complete len:103 (-) Transcript_3130:430-738(-)
MKLRGERNSRRRIDKVSAFGNDWRNLLSSCALLSRASSEFEDAPVSVSSSSKQQVLRGLWFFMAVFVLKIAKREIYKVMIAYNNEYADTMKIEKNGYFCWFD